MAEQQTKNVKDVIAILCSLLDSDGRRLLTPETFRLAKFNDATSLPVLRNVLGELLVLIKTNVFNEQTRDIIAAHSDDLDAFIRRELTIHGNPVCGDVSSRFYLLCICWLVCEKDVLEKIVLYKSVKIGEEIAETCAVSKCVDKTRITERSDPLAQVMSLRWLFGIVEAKMRMMRSISLQKKTLLHEIHTATDGAGFSKDRSHLSMLEVYLLRHPKEMDVCLKRLNEDNLRLTNLIEWKSREDVFWKWMESVLQVHMKEITCSSVIDLAKDVAQSRKQQFVIAHDELSSLIAERETYIDALDRWIEVADANISVKDRAELVEKVEEKISKRLSLRNNDSSFINLHYPDLLCYEKSDRTRLRDKNKNYFGQTSPEKLDPMEMYTDVDTIIPQLQSKIEEMSNELNKLYLKFSNSLS